MTEISTYYQNCICCNSFNSELIGSGHDFEYDSCINSFKFHKCLNCGHIYLKNIPNRKELKIIYPIEYGNYSSSRINSFAFKVKSFLDSLSLRRIKKFTGKVSGLLDVGCADGLTLDCSKSVFKDVEIIEGLEISENAAKKNQRKRL